MSLIVGIDLGTTYSVVSYIDPNTKEPKIIKNSKGNNTTPSVIGFTSPNTYTIGEDAKVMEEMGDINTASFYKLHMGDHNYKISIMGKEFTARDLSSLFLQRLIEDCEKSIGQKITKAVITVPAYFQDAAKNDTIEAGKNAGLDVLNIINEPTAACVAYGLKEDGKNRNILIYDLGGGTFDVTIAAVKNSSISVLGTIGHHELGGRDWDKAIADWLEARFLEETGISIADDSETCAANMVKAENAKKQLTNAAVTEITVDNGEAKCRFKLTRQDFEDLTSYQLGITTDLIDQLFENIHMSWADIDGAVLVGGSTKMPMVKNYILSNNITILDGVHPDEAVAIGAAVQANISNFCAVLPGNKTMSSLGMKSGELNLTMLPGAKVINDVIPHSLGMIAESADSSRFVNDIMIPRNTPCSNARETKRRELRVGKNKKKNHLDIYLLQGESGEPVNCTVAKKYNFYDIEYVNGGKTILEITFLHTINGTIDISAVQTETGHKLKFIEEEIPADMSWVTKTPKEVWGATVASVSGALVMALDLSGSMAEKTCGVSAIDNAKSAMKNFAAQFGGTGVKIGIVAFSDKTRVMCEPTDNMTQVNKAIDSLELCMTGIGNDADPLPTMYSALKPFFGEPFLYALVLTDGMWASCACDSAIRMHGTFVKSSAEIIGMGFGSADIRFLKSISTREDLAMVDDITNLNSNLSSIAKVIVN